MAEQAYRLLRVIIIDSFWKSQVNELNLSGHTQLEGTNGAGKTSLMRLLPLFYGMRPSDIVSKVDQSKNFADYYLPRDSSMLVYEYQRPFDQTCMVLASSDGRGVHFKLIDAAYDAKLFISENSQPYTSMEVERNYKSVGIFCSSFLGIDKYRQVMQNLRSGRKLKDIRQLQQRFSFSDRPCPHIDKVVNGTIEKNLDFDAVKRMLVAIASDHLARSGEDEKEQVGLNKEEISIWLADMQASRAVQKVESKIANWQNDFVSLEELLNKLRHLHAELLKHSELKKQYQLQLNEDKKQQRLSMTQLSVELEQKEQEFKQKVNTISAQIEADEARIDLLDQDKMRFEDDDAANYQLKAEQATQVQHQLNEVTAIINSFEGDISKVSLKFDSLLQDLKLQSATYEGENQQKKSEIKQQSGELLNEISAQNQKQLNALNELLNKQLLQLKSRIHEHATELTYLKRQQESVNIPNELLNAIDDNRALLSDSQESQTQLLQALNQSQAELRNLEKQRDQALAKHLQESRQLDELREQSQLVEQQLLPSEGSLYYFLENEAQADDWKTNIGRVLSPQLLARNDLAPTWHSKSNSLYGLELDLEQLQENNGLLLSEAELREQAQTLDAQRQLQTEKLQQLTEHLEQLSKAISLKNNDISQQQQQIKRGDLDHAQLKVQQERLQLKKQQAVKEAIQTLVEQIADIEFKIKAKNEELVLFEEDKKEQLHELNNQVLEKRLVVESDRDLQLSLLEEQRIEFAETISSRKTDYQKQRKTALDKLDPDGEVDRRTLERKKLEQDLKRCAEFSQKAREYDRFMNERYCHRDKLADKNQSLNLENQQLKSDFNEVKEKLSSEINALRKSLKEIGQKQDHNDDLVIQLEQSHKLCEASGIEARHDPAQQSSQADLAISFCNDWLSQFTAKEKRLNQELTRFSDNLRQRHSTSQLFENWQKLVIDNDIYNGAETLFKYRNAIGDLLSSALQLQKITGQSVIINANMINEFYQHIENFGRRIAQIGKKLSASVTSLAHFKALADINVGTVMKQEELDYWGPLQQFSRSFELCRDQLREGSTDIPDELIESMRNLARYLPSEGLRLEHHNLFDIEFTITEKGQIKHARNARQLKKISSTGLSYLAMLSLFAGILVMLRGNGEHPSSITLPVDELGELAAENIDLLLQMFSDNQIQMLSASPSTDRHVLALYDRLYKLKDNRIYNASIPTSRLDELLAMRTDKMPNESAEKQEPELMKGAEL